MRKVHLLLLRAVVCGPELEPSWSSSFLKQLSRGWSVRTFSDYLNAKWAKGQNLYTPNIVHRALCALIDADLLTFTPAVPPVTFRSEYALDDPRVLEKVRATLVPIIADPNRREHAVSILVKIMPREKLESLVERDLNLGRADARCLIDG